MKRWWITKTSSKRISNHEVNKNIFPTSDSQVLPRTRPLSCSVERMMLESLFRSIHIRWNNPSRRVSLWMFFWTIPHTNDTSRFFNPMEKKIRRYQKVRLRRSWFSLWTHMRKLFVKRSPSSLTTLWEWHPRRLMDEVEEWLWFVLGNIVFSSTRRWSNKWERKDYRILVWLGSRGQSTTMVERILKCLWTPRTDFLVPTSLMGWKTHDIVFWLCQTSSKLGLMNLFFSQCM